MCRTTVAIIDLNDLSNVIDLVNLVTTNVVKSTILNICADRVLERHERMEQNSDNAQHLLPLTPITTLGAKETLVPTRQPVEPQGWPIDRL